MKNELVYNKAVIRKHPHYKSVEFNLKANNIQTERELIIRFVDFVEYLGYEKPHYLLINFKESEYKITSTLFEFLFHTLGEQFLEYQIERVFVITEQPEQFKRQERKKTEKITYFSDCKEVWNQLEQVNISIYQN